MRWSTSHLHPVTSFALLYPFPPPRQPACCVLLQQDSRSMTVRSASEVLQVVHAVPLINRMIHNCRKCCVCNARVVRTAPLPLTAL
ncbi:hypothetical protein M405DRAFT_150155 [Rhizopogon salebrosus TDB-379]|nr:hypothetical protein M405DRAFT_150155 [Rhizopogon salebrosus TDB-379]